MPRCKEMSQVASRMLNTSSPAGTRVGKIACLCPLIRLTFNQRIVISFPEYTLV